MNSTYRYDDDEDKSELSRINTRIRTDTNKRLVFVYMKSVHELFAIKWRTQRERNVI